MITMGELRKLQEIKLTNELGIGATYEQVIAVRRQAGNIG